jgi:5-hydroxyisourate hydrolase-like protein (transthyretin family)
MLQTGRRGGFTRIGIHGGMLVAIMLAGMLFAPALAAAIVAPTPTAPAPVNTAAPTLTGTPALGQTLTCSQGSWANNPTSYSYAWLRNGVAIAGQAGSTYVVQAADQGHAISCQVTAGNAGGDYTISGLPSASYRVGFYAYEGEVSNYLDQFFNGKSLEAEANSVLVTAPNTTGGINAELHTGGQIAGRVTDATTHAPLAEIDVCADETVGEHFGGCADTNSNGEYTISSLPSGSYEVSFYPSSEGSGYVGQVYNDKSSVAEATPVSVTAPNTTGGINAELAPVAEGGQISGTVTGPGKVALTNKIEVCAYESGGVGFGGCASTGVGGAYTISGLPAGRYTVYFFAGEEGGNYLTQYYEGKSSYSEAKPVEVEAGEPTTKINAEMLEAGRLTGKVTSASSGAPLAKISVCADEVGGTEAFENCTSTEADGEYTISALPTGKYTVEFSVGYEGGNYLTQYYEDKPFSSEAETVSVVAGASKPTSGIDAKMLEGGQITGTVTDASTHAGIAHIEACASESELERCAETSAGGVYTISGLTSGSYTVSFYVETENLNYLPEHVNNVSVTAGSTTGGVNAEMHPGGQITGRVTDASTHAGLTKIEVCADEIGASFENCAETTAGATSASATSNALAVAAPNNSFTPAKAPVFESKSGDLDFFFKFPDAGTLKWSLFFKNADVGFADSLGLSFGTGESAVAETAKRSSKKKSKKCKKAETKHRGKCVATLVLFASGSQSVPAGTVEVKVHADSKALKALKAGHELHVSGTFTFQAALGGTPVTHTESAVVRLSKKAAKKHGKHKRR